MPIDRQQQLEWVQNALQALKNVVEFEDPRTLTGIARRTLRAFDMMVEVKQFIIATLEVQEHEKRRLAQTETQPEVANNGG